VIGRASRLPGRSEGEGAVEAVPVPEGKGATAAGASAVLCSTTPVGAGAGVQDEHVHLLGPLAQHFDVVMAGQVGNDHHGAGRCGELVEQLLAAVREPNELVEVF
jgi:hypothetical protein